MLIPLLYLVIVVLVEIPSMLVNTTISITALSIVTKHKDSQYTEHKTLSIMTLSLRTICLMILSITTATTMTFGIMTPTIMTVGKMTARQKA